MKEMFEKCYKVAFEKFVDVYKRQPDEKEEKVIREMARITTAMYLVAVGQ